MIIQNSELNYIPRNDTKKNNSWLLFSDCFMNKFWNVVKLEYRRPFLWVLMVVLPVLVSLFMVDLLSAQSLLHLPVGVVRQGGYSRLDDRIVRALDANPVTEVAAVCTDLPECASKMRHGDIYAIVMLSPDLEDRALRYESPVVPVYTNAQSLLINNTLQKEIRTAVGTVGAYMTLKNLPDPIRGEIHSVENPTGNYVGYLGLGLLSALFNLAAMLVGVYAISAPLRSGKIKEWLNAAGNSRFALAFGSLLPAGIILWLEYFVLYCFTRTQISPMNLSEFYTVFAAQGIMIFAGLFFGMALVGITGSMRVATSGAGVIGGPAFAFTGQTFPILAMPTIVKAYAFLLPLTHVLKVQSIMTFGNLGFGAAFDEILILSIKMFFWLFLGGLLMFIRWEKIRNA